MADEIDIRKKLMKEFEEGFLLGSYYGALNAMGPILRKSKSEIDDAVTGAAVEHKIDATPDRIEAVKAAHARIKAMDEKMLHEHPELKDIYPNYKAIRKNSPSEVTINEAEMERQQREYMNNEEQEYIPEKKKKNDDPAYI